MIDAYPFFEDVADDPRPFGLDPEGRCFELAARYQQLDPEATVVHGWPVYRGPMSLDDLIVIDPEVHADDQGRVRYGHAWIEMHGRVLDLTQPAGWRVWTTREFYEAAGQPWSTTPRRYDYDEAANLMAELGHFGPWHTRGGALVYPRELS